METTVGLSSPVIGSSSRRVAGATQFYRTAKGISYLVVYDINQVKVDNYEYNNKNHPQLSRAVTWACALSLSPSHSLCCRRVVCQAHYNDIESPCSSTHLRAVPIFILYCPDCGTDLHIEPIYPCHVLVRGFLQLRRRRPLDGRRRRRRRRRRGC